MKNKTICLVLGTLLLALSFPAEAQQAKKVPRVGLLIAGHAPGGGPIEGLTQGLRQLGWVEGRNISFESRFAEAKLDRLPDLATELVRLNVDVIVASSGAEHGAKQASRSIPIVFVSVGDPVGEGLVASLARPGGKHHGVDAHISTVSRKAAGATQGGFP